MPAYRYYAPQIEEGVATLSQEESRHLVKVMRAQVGDGVELVDGQGTLAQAKLVSTDRQGAHLNVESLVTEPPPLPHVIISQALPRANRLATILEKGTELGASAFWFFPGERGEKQNLSVERAQQVTIAAMKQSGRLYLPEITLRPKITDWTDLPHPTFYGDLSGPPLWPQITSDHLIFVVGPESGLSDAEVAHLQSLGAKPAKLHPNTLRTDTAALAALTLVHHKAFVSVN